MIILIHPVVITVVSLVIWQEIVRTAIIVGILVTLPEIVQNKESLNRSRAMPEYML